MTERCSFRLTKKSLVAYNALREWCRVNRVPMGRMLNATLQAMQGLPHYHQVGTKPKHTIIDIEYPKQTDVEYQIRYNKIKNLTRVKNG